MTKQELDTPALLVDLNRMEANLERMAGFFRTVPAKLRPHFKNHKCPDLAARQLDAGAIGITCATLREAECLVHHGIRSVLLANEIVDSARILRFVDLARRADVIVCVDNEKIAGDLARAGRDRGTQVNVLVDVDASQVSTASRLVGQEVLAIGRFTLRQLANGANAWTFRAAEIRPHSR